MDEMRVVDRLRELGVRGDREAAPAPLQGGKAR